MILDKDQKFIWHPASQMKDYEKNKPLVVIAAHGSYLHLADGRKVIDATASWWCKSLGHNHPMLKKALLKQMENFEHVMLANTTNETIVALSEKLVKMIPYLNKAFYASDGSCAIEIAMKMSLHSRRIRGQTNKNKFIALTNGYHGETAAALSVSDIGRYREPYQAMLFNTNFINPPYVNHRQDPVWQNCEAWWQKIEKQLTAQSDNITAVLVEPIIQGAAGMRIYSQDFLRRLCLWAKEHDVHLIADEIMTGIGRTGKMLACQHANIEPDFLCLSKGLTGGWIPLSVVLTNNEIYDCFYDDYKNEKTFPHSHTQSGNALGASVALAVLNIIEQEKLVERANIIGDLMVDEMTSIANSTHKLKSVRSIGAIVAADLICHSQNRRIGFELQEKLAALGVLLRPLGNTLYWLPPLNVEMSTIFELSKLTKKALSAIAF